MGIGGLWRVWGWLRILKDDALLLYYAWKHPHTPPQVKGLLIALLAYVFSPLDIMPDYLPLIGILDDVMLIPAGLLYLTHMLPVSVRAECREESAKWHRRTPWILGLLCVVAAAWILLLIFGLSYLIGQK